MGKFLQKFCLLFCWLLYLNYMKMLQLVLWHIYYDCAGQLLSLYSIMFSFKSFMSPVIIFRSCALLLIPLLLLHCIINKMLMLCLCAWHSNPNVYYIESRAVSFGVSKTRYAHWRGFIPFVCVCVCECVANFFYYTFFCLLAFSPFFPHCDCPLSWFVRM